MAEITSDLVKKLRDKTGAGMMDCKRALEAANGDMEAANRPPAQKRSGDSRKTRR